MWKLIESYKNLDGKDMKKVSEFIDYLAEDVNVTPEMVQQLKDDYAGTIFDDINPLNTISSIILVTVQNIQREPAVENIAVKAQLLKNYINALEVDTIVDFDQSYREKFVEYIKWGVEENLLDKRMSMNFNLYELAVALKPSRDMDFTYIGLETAQNRYMVKHRGAPEPKETPQYMWMRVAMGLAHQERDPNKWAKEFYEKLSTKEYTAGGSTMVGAGTIYPTLANCFILETQDDIEHIFENVKNIGVISKATGGIGISITKLRSEGSPIKTNNTFSSGPIPFAKIMDSALAAIARAGKKKGAMAIYMENWHIDFPAFLDLRQNAGDDYRRVRTANTAVYISDEFMKRVENGEDWYLFDPAETPELPELYGSKFSRKYNKYVEKAEAGQMRVFNKVPAREQYKNILTQLLSTSHPWITFKDAINLRALNNNTGTIHSSNLCTEVCLPQDRENIAVCNLMYVNLPRHLKLEGLKYGGSVEKNLENGVDWETLEESVRVGIRHLDNLMEVGISPVKEAKNSDDNNRAVGLGIMGLSEVFEHFGYAYDSEEAYKLADRLLEFVSYISVSQSCDLAEERGAYANFEGSMWSKGYVPFDTIEVLEDDRNLPIKMNRDLTLDWDQLRERVKKGVRNATVMMIAPNGNSSLTAGTSPGIDPRFALIFSRTTLSGKFLDINKNLVNKLQELGIWEEVREELLVKQGDISQIEAIPGEIKRVYKTSFQISPYAFIEIASRCQKWIDQSMSRNMYLEDRDLDNMMEVYLEAWRRGVKTTYYLHTKPRHTAEQSTVKVNKATAIKKKGFGAMKSKTQDKAESKSEKVDAVSTAVDDEKDEVSEVAPEPVEREKVAKGFRGGGFGSVVKTTKKSVRKADAKKETSKKDKPVEQGVLIEENLIDSATGSIDLEMSDSTAIPSDVDASIAAAKDDFDDSAKEKVKGKSFGDLIDVACPIDPAARALCDSCE